MMKNNENATSEEASKQLQEMSSDELERHLSSCRFELIHLQKDIDSFVQQHSDQICGQELNTLEEQVSRMSQDISRMDFIEALKSDVDAYVTKFNQCRDQIAQMDQIVHLRNILMEMQSLLQSLHQQQKQSSHGVNNDQQLQDLLRQLKVVNVDAMN
ncbi:hypothetical protein MP228_002402 [Amoeboaphelidium protococcarum]|nr:hypothetical protein MP228_002402 [Amoeboaphelidium protococcarum]